MLSDGSQQIEKKDGMKRWFEYLMRCCEAGWMRDGVCFGRQ